MAALIVCVVTTSGHSEPAHHPAVIIPPTAVETPSYPAREESGILYVQRMSHARTESPSPRRERRRDRPQATATKSSGAWVPPGQAKKKQVPPGQAKKKQVPPGQANKQVPPGQAKGRHKG